MDVAGFRVPDTPRQQRNEDVATDSRRAQPVTMFRNSNSDKQPTPVKCRAALDSDAISHELVGSTIGISPPVPVKPLMGAPRTRRYDEDLSRASYFSKLTQRLQHHGPEKKSRSHTTNDQQQAFDVGADFRGIQDVIAIKLRDLEKKLQQQEQVITELQFSLNDAKTATDTLETEKRQLRLKNEQLELKIKEGSKEALTLRQEVQNCKDAHKRASEYQEKLKIDVTEAHEKTAELQKTLQAAQNESREVQSLLDESRKELREATASAIERNKHVTENAKAKVAEVAQRLQCRDADVQQLQAANASLTAQLSDIPERNFQALSTCVKKILEKLDAARLDILADGKKANQQHQEQHGAIIECLKGLLTASQHHVEALTTSQHTTENLSNQLAEKVEEYNCARLSSEKASRSELAAALSNLETCAERNQKHLLETFATTVQENESLAKFCQQRDEEIRYLRKQMTEQLCNSQAQLLEIRQFGSALQKLEQAPRESPEMVAKLSTLEQQIRHLEDERNEKETQIVRLEESYKERTKALICASDKFAADIVQLTSTFSQREEEYRRAVDCASDLAVKEANRAASENKQEFQRELQQERSRRQALEKELRQAKQDLFVTEEKSRRSEQVHEALGKKLIAAELGSKAVTAHLEEKARALELRLDRDSAGMTQLKVALAEKEMDYANLRSSMEAYEQRIHVLIEHLRCWAQDYAHIGAIRSRLEMLGQIDQSCAATARMREAEQIDIVLAQLRQYCSRQSAGERRIECSPDQTNVSIPQCASDQDHEQNILDLSTFLNAAVATRQSAGHKRGKEVWSEEPRDAILDTSSVRAPSTGSSWKTTPVVKPPAVSPQYTGTKSEPSYPPTVSSSVVLKHTQGKRRAVAPQKAAMRRPVSPTAARTARRIKRKRPETDSAREDASVSR